jgi:hypothetical protein
VTDRTDAERKDEAERPSPETRQAIRTARQIDTLIDQRIREATERGLFDNLSTHGKPVKLDMFDAIDRDAWFVNRTMKSLGATPEWMELGKEIDADEARLHWLAADFTRWLQETRAALRRLTPSEREKQRTGIALRFEDRLARYVQLAEQLRVKIDRFNLQIPVRTLEKPGVWVAHERQRLLGPYTAFLEEQGWQREQWLAPRPTPPAPAPPTANETAAPPSELARRRVLQLWRTLRRRD